MNIDQDQSLDALVRQMPGAIPVLEQFGIDYCCDRHQSLAAAAQAAGLSLDEITRCLRPHPRIEACHRWGFLSAICPRGYCGLHPSSRRLL
ncbi:MAG TPA: DUF542 domain-containing protein [Candidatus Sulfotelmatobacter sp.]|nr:DUF542 domain-containing protein [Candidatus Sulfotelmatobacter sp.]